MRNLGLSGIMSLKISAELRLGTEHSTTKTLQLCMVSEPSGKWAQEAGITHHARPGEHRDTETHGDTRRQISIL